jgi:predicted metal-binding membrane protein
MSRWPLAAPKPFWPIAGGLTVLAWTSLLVWDASPYSRYLHHGDWTGIGLSAVICSQVPGGNWLVPGVLYVGGWILMTAAMMLPTTLPLVRAFGRMISTRQDRSTLHGLLIAGYLMSWLAFGIAAHVFDRWLFWMASDVGWLASNAWAPGVVMLALAGAFQFSSLKYRCLDKCRSPIGFIMGYWHGPRPYSEAFTLGIAHGIYCVGCCWALMLLMFVVGTGSIGWMFALAVVMALEKNHHWGRKLAPILGVTLLAGSAVTLMSALT